MIGSGMTAAVGGAMSSCTVWMLVSGAAVAAPLSEGGESKGS
jgi:hypothetical protein